MIGTQPRTILHVDMDAFYVSVELRRRPDLRGQPVVVGGTGARGVIAAASYEARRFGLHSAMPSTQARRMCPHAVFLPGDHDLYAQVSTQVHEIFQSVTPFIEPLSLDEAFLDVTGSLRLLGSGTDIAAHVREQVWQQLDLRCSVGVAPSKFIAKLASVAAKPRATPAGVVEGRGVWEVRAGEELAFLHPLPVEALWGVGPATLERLTRLGVRTVRDLADLDESTLTAALGKAHGEHLFRLAWAIDDRAVEVDRAMKSIGHEETFSTDRHTHVELLQELVRLADGVAARLRAQEVAARTFSLKIRFTDFNTISRAITLPSPLATARGIVKAVEPLLEAIDPSRGVRLLGVSATNFGAIAEQMSLDDLFDSFPAAEREWQAAEETMDAIRSRFGASAIGPASSVGADGLRLVRRGAQQWGPVQEKS